MSLISDLQKDICKNDKSTKGVFKSMVPFLVDSLKLEILNSHISKAGRPIKTNFETFFMALFHVLDSGAKITSIPDIFGIPKTTFMRYLKFIIDRNFFQKIYEMALIGVDSSNILIVDSFLVKSTDGSKGTGRNPCDRGRRGVKVFLSCDSKLITNKVIIKPANVSENSCLREAIKTPAKKRTRILADAGYVGKAMAKESKNQGYRLIVNPRRTRNGKMTHKLIARDAILLKTRRNRIERLNGMIRRFRAVDVKRFKHIETYTTFVYFAIMLVTIYQIIFY